MGRQPTVSDAEILAAVFRHGSGRGAVDDLGIGKSAIAKRLAGLPVRSTLAPEALLPVIEAALLAVPDGPDAVLAATRKALDALQ